MDPPNRNASIQTISLMLSGLVVIMKMSVYYLSYFWSYQLLGAFFRATQIFVRLHIFHQYCLVFIVGVFK